MKKGRDKWVRGVGEEKRLWMRGWKGKIMNGRKERHVVSLPDQIGTKNKAYLGFFKLGCMTLAVLECDPCTIPPMCTESIQNPDSCDSESDSNSTILIQEKIECCSNLYRWLDNCIV